MAGLRNFALGILRVITNTMNRASSVYDIMAKSHRALKLIGF
jgi:hypothetical protein